MSAPAGQVCVPYTYTIPAFGTTPDTFLILNGTHLPPGLFLNASTGVISGVPNAAGTFVTEIAITDSTLAVSQISVSITITILELACFTVPDGEIGVAYDYTISATGGTVPYVYSLAALTMPPGLNLDPATGEITGTPVTAGKFDFTVQVSDAAIQSASRDYSIVVADNPVVGCNTPPNGQVAIPYQHNFTVLGGTTPYTWSVTVGTLPAGMTLNSSTGIVSGTPTAAVTSTFSVTATDVNAIPGTISCSIVVDLGGPTITGTPGGGTVTVPYSFVFTMAGGTTPYAVAVERGVLPPGITLNPFLGTLTGVPTTIGTYHFTLSITDAIFRVNRLDCTITVN